MMEIVESTVAVSRDSSVIKYKQNLWDFGFIGHTLHGIAPF